MSVVQFIIRIMKQIVLLCGNINTSYKLTKDDCKTLKRLNIHSSDNLFYSGIVML